MSGDASALVRDPGITIADRWRVLTRTDGKHIVYDPLAPLGRRTVRGLALTNLADAEELARRVAQENPTP